MADNIGEVEVEIFVDVARFARQLDKAAKATERMAARIAKTLDRVGKKFVDIGKKISAGIGLPVAAAGILVAKSAATFEQSFTKIEALVGVSRKQAQGWRDDILALGPATGRGPKELAEGMFFVTSSGFRGAEALEVLTASAKASSIGLGLTADVAKAVGATVNTYGKENLNAADATGILIGAVREGQFEASKFAGSIGRVIAVAASLGVDFDEVSAAVAGLTKGGLEVNQAITQTESVLASFLTVTPTVRKELAGMGIDADSLKDSLSTKGLLGTIQDIKKAADAKGIGLEKIFPEREALKAVLSITGKNAEEIEGIFKRLAKDGVGSLNQAFKITAEDSAFRFNQSLAAMEAAGIRLGATVLPPLISLIEALAGWVETAAEAFGNLDTKTKAIIIGFAGALVVLGPLLATIGFMTIGIGGLTVAFAWMATKIVAGAALIRLAFLTMTSGPVLLGAAIAGLVGGFIVFKTTIVELAKGIVTAMKVQLINNFNDNIVIPFKTMLAGMLDAIPDGLKKAIREATGFDLLGAITIPEKSGGSKEADGILFDAFRKAGENAKKDMANFSLVMGQMWTDAKAMIGFGEGGAGTKLLDDAEAAFNKLQQLVSGGSGGGGEPPVPDELSEGWEEAGAAIRDNFGASLEDAILKMKSFGDVGRAVLQDILRHMLRLIVIAPILEGLTGGASTVFDALTGGKAGGGRINGPTLVGERGPEIVNPDGPATVMNAMNSKKAMGGGGVNVIQNITFAVDVKNSVRAEIVNAAPLIADMASGQVFDQMQRQGRR